MKFERIQIRFGKDDLILETGKLAKQADGAVTVQYGGTVVLVTTCLSNEPKEEVDFLPLTVEYQEKTYAAGRIPGGFFKREGRPSESEILAARLIDRPLRPFFPKGFAHEVQIMAIVLSSDGENDPDILSLIGASASLYISGVPFSGPIGACRVGRIDGDFIIQPTYRELERSDLDIAIAGTSKGLIMLEVKAKEVSEEVILKAIEFGLKNLQDTIKVQQDLILGINKPRIAIDYKEIDPHLYNLVKDLSELKLNQIFLISQKDQREEAVSLLSKELEAKLTPEGYKAFDIKRALVELERNHVRRLIVDTGHRIDGRLPSDIRSINCEVQVLPRTHGSGIFSRGQTQSLAITTLGTSSDEQLIEALEGESFKSFMLHYSFPPFSVGETAPVRGPGRREIGHGALAEKALLAIMPTKEEFPYTVRVVSEILESNGSSSMATVCAAALSLMDAGVPIKEPVSGVAMGLIKEGDKKVILTDITGLEDHFGDMDFKVAGTKRGITAMQLDLKIDGINIDTLKEAILQANKARLFILDKMGEVISEPRKELSPYAPRITILKVNSEKIGQLIGPGGKTIRKIIKTTGVTIDIEDDGTVMIASSDASKTEKALEIIRGLTEEAEVGNVYLGKIKRIVPFGAFCEILPGKEGLIHISELADHFVKEVEDEVKVGDEVKVKVIGIDELGRINLSRKQIQDNTAEPPSQIKE